MRIIDKSTSIIEEIRGTVILEYCGQQENFNYHKVDRQSILKLDYKEYLSKKKEHSCDFILELDEFFNIPLSLDLMNRSLYINDELRENIGNLVLREIRYENSTLIVSGRYFHGTISLAYYEIECVKFECVFQIDQRKNRDFKRTLKNLNENTVEFNEKILIEDV